MSSVPPVPAAACLALTATLGGALLPAQERTAGAGPEPDRAAAVAKGAGDSGGGAESGLGSAAEKARDAVRRVGETRFRLGEVEFDAESKEVFLPVAVNMREGGPMEYLLVHESGKTHESIFSTKASPLHLRIALELLGFRAGEGDVFHPLLTEEMAAARGGTEAGRGDGVEVWFRREAIAEKDAGEMGKEGEATNSPASHSSQDSHESDADSGEGEREKGSDAEKEMDKEKEKELLAAPLVLDGTESLPMAPEPWVFTGSRVENGTFQAETEGSIIAIYLDPYALFNMTREGADNDERWGANPGLIPPLGEKGTIVLRKVDQNDR